MSLTDFLTTVVEILDEARVPYMLTGSLAAAHYALPRATQDIDFIVDVTPEQIDDVVDRLLDKCFYVDREAAFDAYRTRSQFNAIDPEQGWKLDLMIRKDRPFSVEEFGRRRPAVILDVEISLTSLEDLILAKLEWSRAGESDLQRRDVLNLVEAAGDSIDRVYVEHGQRRWNCWTNGMRFSGRDRPATSPAEAQPPEGSRLPPCVAHRGLILRTPTMRRWFNLAKTINVIH